MRWSFADSSYGRWLSAEVYEVLLPELMKRARELDKRNSTDWEVAVFAEVRRLEGLGATDAVATAIVLSWDSGALRTAFLTALSESRR